MAQIGTIKLETQNSGVVDVPVFETGDSASGVYEFVRVETASGTGFIPVTDPTDATYPYLRVQSQNNGIVAVTDTAGSDIPDSVEYRFEASEFDETSGDWPASIGSTTLSALGSPSAATGTPNNEPIVTYDGSDDAHEDASITLTQPDAMVVALRVDSTGIGRFLNGDAERQFIGEESGSWAFWSGSFVDDGALTTGTWYIFSAKFDGADSYLRQNGSQIASGDPGANNLDGFLIAVSAARNDYDAQRVADVMLLQSPSDQDIQDAESVMNSKYGIY